MKFLTRIWFKKIGRDITRQKMLTIALILLCFFGTGSYLALTMGYTNLEASYKHIYQQTNFADAEFFTHSDICFNTTELEEVINNFTAQYEEEIQAINYRLITEIGYNVTKSYEDPPRQILASGRAIGIQETQSTNNRVNDLIFTSGTYSNLFTKNNSVLLEAHFAQLFRIKEGDTLTTKIFDQSYDFIVQGVVFSPEYLIIIPSKYDFLPTNAFGIIYLPIERLQAYTNLTGLANNLIVKMKPNVRVETRDDIIDEFADVLETHTNKSFAPPVMQEFQVSNLALMLDLETFEEIAFILPIVVLGVASVSIYITLGRMVQSQKRNIGIASSLGYFPNDILMHYICFALVIGGLGSILGAFFGIIVSGGVTWIYSYFMRFPQIIKIQIQFHLVIFALITGLGVSFLSGIIPAWRASRMVPREALRVAVTIDKGSRAFLEKLLFVNPFGLRLTIPLRNLFRNRIRTFATIIAMAAAVMILVVSFAFIDSVSAGVNRQFNQTSQYDMIVNYDGLKYSDLGAKDDIAYIQNLPGVLSVDPVLQIPSIINIGEKQQEVLITAWNSSIPSTHNFYWSSPQDTLWSNGSIVVCSGLARKLNIHVGSSISYGYPHIPFLKIIYKNAEKLWNDSYSEAEPEVARNKTLEFLNDLISQNRESISFSDDVSEIDFDYAPITISGVSREIWESIVYTTVQTITSNMGIDIFKTGLDIDLTPSSQFTLKISQPTNITLLDEIKESISQLEGIRSIQFSYDLLRGVDYLMAIFNAIVALFLIFACLLAGVAIFTTIYVNFQERQREIATMLTIGLSDSELLFIMTVENLIQALLGILLGIPTGLWFASWLLDNILRVFYFEVFVLPTTWIIIWVGVIIVVLISQIPAVYNGVKLDLAVVTSELSN